ncbi:MAG: lactate dehydrogenase [Rhodospirillaceae bacterium]|jgi:phosphoglycerate dehydrogenase-like enzyme|nr:lactate dehydrogenase [Rhodospirillaceae bacterium]MBT4117819.1 lactate dehydrogenase [Rhodospirillaceae bacterium]MBT4672947.1 lactate dehydrogenase [Rhodospirillaceae bacterium]MBT4720367.1 lactate dehydrogenase [Rhodospirillaceae bacterium]MBT5178657.1 lactate dehydrogenase [Rhodospirillaceae bacterium]
MATIVFVTDFPDAAVVAKDMAPPDFDLVIVPAGSSEYLEAMAGAEYLVGFVDGLINDALFRCGPNLKLVQLLSAGYEKADMDAARQAGVPVANNGGANSVAVSEHVLMLLLAVSRQLILQHANVIAGRWRGNSVPRVYELRGKTLGIVGLGTIGKKTARLAQAFGMDVIYYDIERLGEDAEDLLDVRFRLFRELLGLSDVVSLHTPLDVSTYHMIGEAELALMKPSAMLINTARGPVVNEADLYDALAAGNIAGAGLDVYDPEPPAADNPLYSLNNVVLTAHMAGPTFESNIARVRNAFDNVQRVASGKEPFWLVSTPPPRQ